VRGSIVALEALPTFLGRSYAVGASMGYRRSVHDAVGGFDERFECGGDDIAFSLRAHAAGFRIGFAPDARCQYRLRETVRGAAAQQRRYGQGRALLTAHYTPEHDRGVLQDIGRSLWEATRRLLAARSWDDVRIAYLRSSFQGARTVAMAQARAHAGPSTE
jgi:GT2 family glycosyltransferase